jgi:hypothetical protein
LPRAARWPSLLIDAIDPADPNADGSGGSGGSSGASVPGANHTSPVSSQFYAGSHQPERSIMHELERAAMEAGDEVAGGVGGSAWNMTSGGEWRLVIRGGNTREDFEGDLGTLRYWSVRLCGDPQL